MSIVMSSTSVVKKLPKETKAERLMREEQSTIAYHAEREAIYLPRLMSVMQRALTSNFNCIG